MNSNANDDAEDLAQENLDLKMLVEEKQRDLEDRNQLLVKARNAIEGERKLSKSLHLRSL